MLIPFGINPFFALNLGPTSFATQVTTGSWGYRVCVSVCSAMSWHDDKVYLCIKTPFATIMWQWKAHFGDVSTSPWPIKRAPSLAVSLYFWRHQLSIFQAITYQLAMLKKGLASKSSVTSLLGSLMTVTEVHFIFFPDEVRVVIALQYSLKKKRASLLSARCLCIISLLHTRFISYYNIVG